MSIIDQLRQFATQENVDYLLEEFKELDKIMYGKDKHCKTCLNYKTMDCPNSSECYSTANRPYFVAKK